MIILLFFIVLLGAGLFGMMGLGGGLLYVPLLSWAGLDFKTGAVPLSNLLGVATGLAATVTYLIEDRVHIRTGGVAIVPALIGAPVGAALLGVAPVPFLKLLFSLVAFSIAARVVLSREPAPVHRSKLRTAHTLTIIAGFFVGVASGLLGIGGGFLLLPLLLASGFPIKEAVATSSLVVTFSSLASFLSRLPHSEFSIRVAAVLFVSALVGSRIGGLWASRHARPRTLRLIVGGVIFAIAVKVLLEGLGYV